LRFPPSFRPLSLSLSLVRLHPYHFISLFDTITLLPPLPSTSWQSQPSHLRPDLWISCTSPSLPLLLVTAKHTHLLSGLLARGRSRGGTRDNEPPRAGENEQRQGYAVELKTWPWWLTGMTKAAWRWRSATATGQPCQQSRMGVSAEDLHRVHVEDAHDLVSQWRPHIQWNHRCIMIHKYVQIIIRFL
jgi:hypothetical protein